MEAVTIDADELRSNVVESQTTLSSSHSSSRRPSVPDIDAPVTPRLTAPTPVSWFSQSANSSICSTAAEEEEAALEILARNYQALQIDSDTHHGEPPLLSSDKQSGVICATKALGGDGDGVAEANDG